MVRKTYRSPRNDRATATTFAILHRGLILAAALAVVVSPTEVRAGSHLMAGGVVTSLAPLLQASVGQPLPDIRDEVERLPWSSPEVTIIAQERPIRQVLTDFGEQQGIKIVVDPTISGNFSGEFRGLSPAYFFDQITRAYNLTWFFAGGVLYVSPADSIQLKTRTLRFASPDQVLMVINEAVLNSLDGTVQAMANSRVLLVTGPPLYVNLVEDLISTIDSEQEFRRLGETVVEVFPLKNAWAYDVTIDSGVGVPSQILGVASTLQQLIGGGGTSNVEGAGFAVGGVPTGVPGALEQSLQALQQRSEVVPGATVGQNFFAQEGVEGVEAVPGSGAPGAVNTNNARIVADVRTNSVVIRDTRENMDFYAKVIDRLDVPVRVVEITAAILDLRLGYSAALGLNSIGISTTDGGVGLATGGVANALIGGGGGNEGEDGSSGSSSNFALNLTATTTAPVSGSGADSALPSNIVASAVFGTTAITAAINALTQDNKARILSRPQILTLDNFGAIISQQETFYVNSVGQFVSDLFNVSTGLTLQVVPRIVGNPRTDQIALQVRIEDGSVGAQVQGTALPSVRQATLTTQALINRNESLLIGGLFIKSDQQETSGLPLLSKIPVLGYLFSTNARGKNMVERLFLITPRIVDVSSGNLGNYSEFFQPSPTVLQAIDQTLPPKAVNTEYEVEYQRSLPRTQPGWPTTPGGPPPPLLNY